MIHEQLTLLIWQTRHSSDQSAQPDLYEARSWIEHPAVLKICPQAFEQDLDLYQSKIMNDFLEWKVM